MRHELSSTAVRWVAVQSPGTDELAAFIREAGLTSADAEFVAQATHRPAVTVRPKYLLILIQVPVFNRTLRLTSGVPIFFCVTAERVFSLHYEPIVALDKIRSELMESDERREAYLGSSPAGAALSIIGMLYESAFSKLDRLAKHIDIAEDAVFQGNERKMVEEVSLLTRDVMDFRKAIRPQKHLFLAFPNHALLPADLATDWSRLHHQLLKMWDILESMFESVRELSSSNFTLLQYKENELLKILTIYSIIAIPMLILVDPFFVPSAPDATIVDTIVYWCVVGVLVIMLLSLLIGLRRRGRL